MSDPSTRYRTIPPALRERFEYLAGQYERGALGRPLFYAKIRALMIEVFETGYKLAESALEETQR